MEPLSIRALLENTVCCGSGCRNCPYSPRHTTGTTHINKEWVVYKVNNSDATYEEYLSKKSIDELR